MTSHYWIWLNNNVLVKREEVDSHPALDWWDVGEVIRNGWEVGEGTTTCSVLRIVPARILQGFLSPGGRWGGGRASSSVRQSDLHRPPGGWDPGEEHVNEDCDSIYLSILSL